MLLGREIIYTDVPVITRDNVCEIVKQSIMTHDKNADMMDFLLNYEKGIQPIERKKLYRSDINCKCVDNVANEITEFKLGFNWGNPITLVQRGETENEETSAAITLLNKCYDAENIKSKTQELGRFVEIVGIGHSFIDPNMDYEDGDSYFNVSILDPRCSYVIKSSYYLDKRDMLGVTFRKDSKGLRHFTCFSKDERFEINHLFEHEERSGERNPLEEIPIIEWTRSFDRMGCFERQISEMDNLNLLISDFTNDVDQNTQAVWHANDVEFPTMEITLEDGTKKEIPSRPKTNEWIQTFTAKDGKTPFITPLSIDYDYTGMLNNIIHRRALILQKCNVPSRNDNSGGSTGIAMSDATGWTQAEVDATRQDQIKDSCKSKEVKVVLKAIKKCPEFKQDSPLAKLKYTDVKTSIKRQKTYEMTTKINAYATGVSHGIYYEDMLNAINLFDDPQQVAENSREMTEKYLKSLFEPRKTEAVGGLGEKAPNADRIDQDKSDQEVNSKMIGGPNVN